MNRPSVGSAEELSAAVAEHGVHLVGRLTEASNAAFVGWAGPIPIICKPVRGERPLWDFPTGCLAHRERASYLLSDLGGFSVVPPTVLHDGPAGPATVQWWVTDPSPFADATVSGPGDEAEASEDSDTDEVDEVDDDLFVLLPPDEVGAPWLPVFTGELPDGETVVLAHADRPDLRSVAVLDAVLNNSDRKGSHVLTGVDGTLWGIDHGVALHQDPKLRTVLWGWAQEPLPEDDLERVRKLSVDLGRGPVADEIAGLLTRSEVEALRTRLDGLLSSGRHPVPSPGWPPVPWPAL